MKSLLRLGLVALGLILAYSTPAFATACSGGSGHTCYAIHGETAWTNTAMWSSTSGGATCTCAPVAGDDVVFDGSTPSGTYQFAVSLSLDSLDASLAGAGVNIALTNGTTMTITGTKFALSSAMTFGLSGTNTIAFAPGAGVTTIITTAGLTLPSVTCNGSNGTTSVCQQADNMTAGAITLTQGVWDDSTNNNTVTALSFLSNNSNTRTLDCGTAAWTLRNTAAALLDFTTATGLTVSCSNAWTIAGTPTVNRTFILGAQTIGTLNVPANASAQWAINFTIAAGATIGTLNIAAPAQVTFTQGQTLTLSNAPSWTGTIGGPIALGGSAGMTGTGVVTIALPGATTLNYISLASIAFTGVTVTCNNCWDFGHNSGVTITAPSGGSGGHIIGG